MTKLTMKSLPNAPAEPKTEVARIAARSRWWLMKSEPDVFSFAELTKRPEQKERWDGVRNFQARNLMRDCMKVGDWVVFYHSSAEPPGVAGLARVVEAASPDLTALDRTSPYFDPKATPEDPRWVCVTVGKPTPLARYVALEAMRKEPKLADMLLLRRGQRLSILPLTESEFKTLCALAGSPGLAKDARSAPRSLP